MEVIQQGLSAVLVLSLLAATLWWLRRKGLARFSASVAGRRSVRRLQHLERLHLTGNHSLHLVRAGDRVLLISLSPASCMLVESWPGEKIDPPPTPHPVSPGLEARP